MVPISHRQEKATPVSPKLEVPGAKAFLSWPSQARLARHNADEAALRPPQRGLGLRAATTADGQAYWVSAA
jgi:hypothetical protein